MYDGYILAPGAFDDLLNNLNEKISATNAQAHYNSTQHLRDQDLEQRQLQKNKKSAYTMTDASTSDAMPIPPDILFKLHFDAKRKDRALNTNNRDDDGKEKDFVNVADLDGQAVDDLLKLIEREQIKRQQPKPSEIISAKNRLENVMKCALLYLKFLEEKINIFQIFKSPLNQKLSKLNPSKFHILCVLNYKYNENSNIIANALK